jgi:hypothetical protein
VSRSSRHLSRQAAKPGVIGPETPLDPQSRTGWEMPAASSSETLNRTNVTGHSTSVPHLKFCGFCLLER